MKQTPTGIVWAQITGKPKTLAGYGITDKVVLTTGSYSDPSWIFSLEWNKITHAPEFEPALGNPLVDGYILSSTTAGVRSWIEPAGGTIPTDGGTTILDGLGPPSIGLGADGDYYLDTVADILYGPKLSAGLDYATGQNVMAALTPVNSYFDQSPLEIGTKVKLLVNGRITAVKYWRQASTTQISRKVNIWNTTTFVRLATETVTDDGGGTGWKTVALSTPLIVAANDIVLVSVNQTDDYSRTESPGFPFTIGDITALDGLYFVGSDAYPSTSANVNFFVDVVFEKEITGDVWPIALISDTGGGGGSGLVVEVPSGAINGANSTFVLSQPFDPDTLGLYLNGLRQRETEDFTITDLDEFTLTSPPIVGDSLQADYYPT